MSFFSLEDDVLNVLAGQSWLSLQQIQELIRIMRISESQKKPTPLLKRLLPQVAESFEVSVLSLVGVILETLLKRSWISQKTTPQGETVYAVTMRGQRRSRPSFDDMGEPA